VEATGAPGLAADRLAVERIVGNVIENALRALEATGGGHVAPHGARVNVVLPLVPATLDG
jgi:signal transduction histidine kinase